MTAHVAILGYGHLGGALAGALLRAGHRVTLASRPGRPQGAAEARAADPALTGASVATAADAVAAADLTLLAVPFSQVDEVLAPLRGVLEHRVLVDATNPVGPGLTHGLRSERSGAEHIAGLVPSTSVVKAFSVYGFENLTAPPSGADGLRPVMPYAGDDAEAKGDVAGLIARLGWEPLDVGPLSAALDLEHLTLLWVRMVRLGGRDPHLVWAALRGARTAGSPA
jgi:predicted dinucleotide-binding enzyme